MKVTAAEGSNAYKHIDYWRVAITHFIHIIHSELTLTCPECECDRLFWAESAIRIGSYHYGIQGLSLESRYLNSRAGLSGDNDASICPCHFVCEAPCTGRR